MKFSWIWLALLLLCGGPTVVRAQLLPTIGGGSGAAPGQDGFGLYSVSANASYFSASASSAYNPYGQGGYLNSDGSGGASASVGWSRHWRASALSIVYSPSYTADYRYRDLSSFNHSLSISGGHQFSRKWSAKFALGASLATFNQFIFGTSLLDNVVAAPSTFDTFSGAVLGNQYGNQQLASVTPGLRLFLFGDRSLGTTFNSALSYAHSSRLTTSIAVSGSRYEHVSDQLPPGTQYPYVIPMMWTGSVSASLEYSYSRNTQIGASLSGMRVYSIFEDAYYSNASVNYGRTLGRHWVVQLTGGGGITTPVQHSFAVSRGVQYTASASLAYKTRSHAFMASGSRLIGDYFGLNATSTIGATASWFWQHPGSGWSARASGSWSDLRYTGISSMRTWGAAGSLARGLTHAVSLQLQYAYLFNVGGFPAYLGNLAAAIPEYNQSSAQIAVVWSPQRGRR
jgi:hypothetical protein